MSLDKQGKGNNESSVEKNTCRARENGGSSSSNGNSNTSAIRNEIKSKVDNVLKNGKS